VIGDRALGSGEFSQGGCHTSAWHAHTDDSNGRALHAPHDIDLLACSLSDDGIIKTMHMHVKSILTWLLLTSCLQVTEER